MAQTNLKQLLVLLCCYAAISGSLADVAVADPTSLLQGFNQTDESGPKPESELSARTRRIDPVEGFRIYEGGYNITDKHYWTSTLFTGRCGYIIAALVLAAAGVFIVVSVVSRFFCRSSKQGGAISGKRHTCFGIFCVCLFLLVLVPSAFVLSGTVGLSSRAQSVKQIVQETGIEATDTIYSVTRALGSMQNLTGLPSSIQETEALNSTTQSLNREADEIEGKAEEAIHLVSQGIKILEAVTIVAVLLNLIGLLAMLITWVLRRNCLFHLLTYMCWMLDVLFWVFLGLYFSLDLFAGDTCLALAEYQLNPQNSTLGSIIPCNEKLSADALLHDVSAGIHSIIDQVNADIATVKAQADIQDLQDLDYVCNPFSGPPEFLYQPENCSSNTVKIGDIPQLLKHIGCSKGNNAGCIKQEDIASAIDYNTVSTYTGTIQGILDVYPGMQRLADCQMVKEGFSEILGNECSPLKRYARTTWAALAALATVVAVFVVASAAMAALVGERRHLSQCIADATTEV